MYGLILSSFSCCLPVLENKCSPGVIPKIRLHHGGKEKGGKREGGREGGGEREERGMEGEKGKKEDGEERGKVREGKRRKEWRETRDG